MQLSELIQELQKFPPDSEVYVKYNVFFYEIESVSFDDKEERVYIVVPYEKYLYNDDEVYD
ncbi:hypothetical protein NIES21_15430 [Anabaenopsis circularis NIES-21]|uniref:Uncharacterized protein n=1 Tax=Anabaenopsis circularis NIES-21 TaxID=1085406 RepID=A0A1Z4GDY5_9CYAN|nr:hypothetical protein NIES21_15430 [Anabaenopsis circularis NIES-21]